MKQNKMAEVNLRFEMSIKTSLDGFLLQMLRWSVTEITLFEYIKQLFFSISVSRGRIFTSISKNNC